MRKALLLACAVLFISSVCFAQTPGRAPLTEEALTAILGPSTTASEGDSQQEAMTFAAKRPELWLKATCTANCLGGGTVTCSGTTTCSAKNGTCSSPTGTVTCGSTTKSCPVLSMCTRCNLCGDCYSCCICSGHTGSFCSANC
jgi:hypothetical protein